MQSLQSRHLRLWKNPIVMMSTNLVVLVSSIAMAKKQEWTLETSVDCYERDENVNFSHCFVS